MSGCWYALGELTAAPDADEEIWLAPTCGELVTSLIRRMAHDMIPDDADHRTARLAYAIGVADELQARALDNALRNSIWSYAGATDAEIGLLHHDRGTVVPAGTVWASTLELVVVRPLDVSPWEIPGGKRVTVIDPTTDSRLLASLVGVGMLKAGRLD